MIRSTFVRGLVRLWVFTGLLAMALVARGEVIDIDNAKLQDLIAQNVAVVDVRRLDEWTATGLVEGSTGNTFFDSRGGYDAEKWLANLADIVQPGEPVALICHVGSRSKMIADWLSKGVGFDKVYNVEKGIDSWIRNGNPTVKYE